MVDICLISYKRPQFLEQCLKGIEKAGTEFELHHHKNDDDNRGQDVISEMIAAAKNEFFVVVEEDMIWFQQDWLKNLVAAFKQKPDLSAAAQALGFKNEWGALATNTLSDEVNRDMTKEDYIPLGLIEYEVGGVWYWGNVRPFGGAVIYRTEVLKQMNLTNPSSTKNGALYQIWDNYERNRYVGGRVRDTYIYHAYTPYWNRLFPDVFKEKQKGKSVEQAMKEVEHKFNFKNERPMQMFLSGNFESYANELYENTHHGE